MPFPLHDPEESEAYAEERIRSTAYGVPVDKRDPQPDATLRWEQMPAVSQALLEGADRVDSLTNDAVLWLDQGKPVKWQVYDDLTHEKHGAIAYMRRRLDQIEACAKREAERRGW